MTPAPAPLKQLELLFFATDTFDLPSETSFPHWDEVFALQAGGFAELPGRDVMKLSATVLFALLVPGISFAQDLPGCAATGSKTMMIGGKPALRLSDVANCPPDMYEIVSSIMIDGQPMVRFKPVHFGKARCAVVDDSTVLAEGQAVTPQGSLHCATN